MFLFKLNIHVQYAQISTRTLLEVMYADVTSNSAFARQFFFT